MLTRIPDKPLEKPLEQHTTQMNEDKNYNIFVFIGKKYCLDLQVLKEMLFNEKISSQSIVLFHDALWSDLIQDAIHGKISKPNAL